MARSACPHPAQPPAHVGSPPAGSRIWSRPARSPHIPSTRTLGRRSGPGGLFMLGRGRSRGVPTSPGRNARGSGPTGRGVGVLRGVRGFVQYAQSPASTARGSWSSRPEHGRPVAGRCGSASWRILVENPGFTRPLHSGLNPHHQPGKPRRNCQYTKRLIRRERPPD